MVRNANVFLREGKEHSYQKFEHYFKRNIRSDRSWLKYEPGGRKHGANTGGAGDCRLTGFQAHKLPKYLSSSSRVTVGGQKRLISFRPSVSRGQPVGQRSLGVGAALLVDTSVALPRTWAAHPFALPLVRPKVMDLALPRS